MADLKLFRFNAGHADELASLSPQVEKSLQQLFESNLEQLLGIRFLASEFSTGPVHGGRVDTLGLDEDASPVIVEYKRLLSENVINQGLFYLDWLLDHKKDFQWLVMDKLGAEIANKVDWSAPRLICIAGDFTRYDGYAVKQIPRNIELLRYRRFGEDLLLLELVHAPRTSARSLAVSAASEPSDPGASPVQARDPYQSQRLDYRLGNASPELRAVWDTAADHLTALGDDVQVKQLKLYTAFKRLRNYACLELYPSAQTVVAYLRVDPDTLTVEPGFTRDVRTIGHFGTGDLEVVMRTPEDVAKATSLFQRAYEQS